MDSPTVPPPLLLNFADPGFRRDPFPVYRRFLQDDPCHRTPFGSWFLTRHRDVAAILTDSEAARKMPERALHTCPAGPLREFNAETLLFKDPPDYVRLRGAVAHEFVPSHVAALTDSILRIIAETLEPLRHHSEFDLITDFAALVPERVIGDWMGIPRSDLSTWSRWSQAYNAAIEPLASPADHHRGADVVSEFMPFLRDWIRSRSRAESSPSTAAGDLTASLLHHHTTGRISTEETAANLLFIFSSGSGTTRDLIGNGVHLLLEHPDALRSLRDQPDLLPNAVEEILRLRPPVHIVHRFATREIQLDQHTLQPGDSLTLCLAAANRDPTVFSNPDSPDLQRPAKSNRHLAFGAGMRFCMGAPLARLQARLTLQALLQTFPEFQLARDPIPGDGIVFRGFNHLYLGVRP